MSKTTSAEPQPGVQGEGGVGCRERARRRWPNWRSSSTCIPNQITTWKAQLLEGAAGVFGSEARAEPAAPAVDVKTLHAKIGELTLSNDFLSGALGKAGLLSAKR